MTALIVYLFSQRELGLIPHELSSVKDLGPKLLPQLSFTVNQFYITINLW